MFCAIPANTIFDKTITGCGATPAKIVNAARHSIRAIQERRYRPIGDKTDKSFNVRIIAATNEDLENCGRA